MEQALRSRGRKRQLKQVKLPKKSGLSQTAFFNLLKLLFNSRPAPKTASKTAAKPAAKKKARKEVSESEGEDDDEEYED